MNVGNVDEKCKLYVLAMLLIDRHCTGVYANRLTVSYVSIDCFL